MFSFSAHSFRANQFIAFLIRHQAKVSQLVTLLLLVAIAWISGRLFWQLYQPVVGPQPWRAVVTGVETDSRNNRVDLTPVVKANWFGVESKTKPQPKVVERVVDAPKTKLKLVLVGVVASTNADNSLAVISNRGIQETLAIGETISGTRARLNNVLKDRVIIDNQGRKETLMLEGVDYRKASAPQAPQKSTRPSANKAQKVATSDEADLNEIREAISGDPQQLLKYIRLSQVNRDGKLIGYRVRPGRQRALFDAVGLKDGDIAVELNGSDLTDPATMGQVWQSLNELSEINLTVERDGQRYDIYVQL